LSETRTIEDEAAEPEAADSFGILFSLKNNLYRYTYLIIFQG